MPRADIGGDVRVEDDIDAEETFGEVFEPMFYAAEGLMPEDLEEYKERVIHWLEMDAEVTGEDANAAYVSEPNPMLSPFERVGDRLEILIDEYRRVQADYPGVVAPLSLAEAANVWRAAAYAQFDPDLPWGKPRSAEYYEHSGLYTWPGFRNGRRAF